MSVGNLIGQGVKQDLYYWDGREVTEGKISRQAVGESKARTAPDSINVPLITIGRRLLS